MVRVDCSYHPHQSLTKNNAVLIIIPICVADLLKNRSHHEVICGT